jgi:Cu(I)/Ag(I) efflux system membrane fusion protein
MKRWLRIVIIILAVFAVVLAGIAIGRATAPSVSSNQPALSASAQEVWTCSMHPQVRLERPGMCPICEMPLIPAASASPAASGETPSMQLSDHALAMASVETVPVERRRLNKDVRAVGKIEYNESSLATITARIDGYAERLFVNFTGIDIRKGDHLVEIYSPDLLVAQQELLIALKAGGDQTLVDTARIKLRLLGLTGEQIDAMTGARQLTERITLYSPIDGTVIEKMVVQNAGFKAGDALYRIANLDTVWVYLDIYEYDLPWLRYGQRVELTTEGYPGRLFEGMVTFIQPIVNETTRTIRVPVHISNADHALKPGMYVSAVIKAMLGPDGSAAPTGVEGKFTCPMHPQVLENGAGKCPICEMPLEQIPHAHRASGRDHAAQTQPVEGFMCPMRCEDEKVYQEPGRCPVCNMKLEAIAQPSKDGLLTVPVTAVLDSGTRTIVYVEKARGLFEPREVTVGPRSGDFYPVLKGLREGERVVTRGGFLIDSQFQITGHSSLFYPGGLHASMGHQHDKSDSGGEAPRSEDAAPSTPIPGHQH